MAAFVHCKLNHLKFKEEQQFNVRNLRIQLQR